MTPPAPRRVGVSENAEFVAIGLLVQSWDDIAPWLIEELFDQEVTRRAFTTLAQAGGHEGQLLQNALDLADPEVREVLERSAVSDIDVPALSVAMNLIGLAVRRTLAARTGISDPEEIRQDRDARNELEKLDDDRVAQSAAESLLWWLGQRGRTSERDGGEGEGVGD